MSITTTNFDALHNLLKTQGTGTFCDWIRVRGDNYITKYADLPVSALAGFDVAPHLRRALINYGNELLLSDVFNALRFGAVNLKTKKLFATRQAMYELCLTCLQFLEMENSANYHIRPISENIAWIIPDSKFRDNGTIDPNFKFQIYREVEEYFDDSMEDWENWLPWMSLSIAMKLKSWRSPKINCVKRAIFKLPLIHGIECEVYEPWIAGYPEELANLPLPVLYQCEKDAKTLDVISQLSSIGLKKVNDLRVFHTEAIQFANDVRGPHTVFYNKFNF